MNIVFEFVDFFQQCRFAEALVGKRLLLEKKRRKKKKKIVQEETSFNTILSFESFLKNCIIFCIFYTFAELCNTATTTGNNVDKDYNINKWHINFFEYLFIYLCVCMLQNKAMNNLRVERVERRWRRVRATASRLRDRRRCKTNERMRMHEWMRQKSKQILWKFTLKKGVFDSSTYKKI